MTRRVAVPLAITLFIVSTGGSTAAAQDARGTLERTTRPGDRLTVDLRDQSTIEGRLVTTGADVLTIETVGGPASIPYSALDRVRRRRNGVLLGSIIGLGAGVTFGIPARMLVNVEKGNGDRALITLAACGLGIGLAIDAGISLNRTIYRQSIGDG